MTRKSCKRATILIADDDPTMLELTAVVLRRCGYDIITAHDGDAALKVFIDAQHPIQLVISDGAMPGLKGTQLLRAVKTMSPSTAALLVSGTVSPSTGDAGTPWLAKPFRPAKLAALVRELLNACDFESIEREQSLGRTQKALSATANADEDISRAGRELLNAITPCGHLRPNDSAGSE